jgi:glycosyltransferase involved in cell wall biosynthesis
MKGLILTNHFYPENFKINELAFNLAGRGLEITVITCIPNYPEGRFFRGYGFFTNRVETINGVKIYRLPLIPRGSSSRFRLALNYFSFLFSTIVFSVFFAFRNRFDFIFVHQTSPVFIGIPAIIVKKIQKIPLYFWVLDLWPESVKAASGFSNKFIIKLINKIVKWIYSHCDKILISSDGFRESILTKGNFQDKIITIPNWAESVFENNETGKDIPPLPDGFKIMYAGNIGLAQDIEHLFSCILKLKDHPQIKWVIMGDGQKLNWAREFVEKNDLHQTVSLTGRYPLEVMPSFFSKADVMLLTLKDSDIFSLTVPERLQAFMACSKPVLAMVNGEAASIITESGSGFVSKPGDEDGFIKNVLKFYSLAPGELNLMGKKGKEYYTQKYTRTKILDKIYDIIGK